MFESETYRQARQGEWMHIARDQRRFRRRISNYANRIEWCLHGAHTKKLNVCYFQVCYNKLQKSDILSVLYRMSKVLIIFSKVRR